MPPPADPWQPACLRARHPRSGGGSAAGRRHRRAPAASRGCSCRQPAGAFVHRGPRGTGRCHHTPGRGHQHHRRGTPGVGLRRRRVHARRRVSFGPGHAQNDLSSWTRIGTPLLRLDAGAAADELVTIRVPANAVRGAHDAVVWAETSSPAPTGGGVTLVNRVGIRVYLTVDKSARPRPRFASPHCAPRARRTDRSWSRRTSPTYGRGPLSVSGRLTLGQGGSSGLRAGPFRAGGGCADHARPIPDRLGAGTGRGATRALAGAHAGHQRRRHPYHHRHADVAGRTASPASPGGRSLIGAAVLLAALLLMAAATRRKRL